MFLGASQKCEDHNPHSKEIKEFDRCIKIALEKKEQLKHIQLELKEKEQLKCTSLVDKKYVRHIQLLTEEIKALQHKQHDLEKIEELTDQGVK